MREREVRGLRDGGLQPRAGDGPGRRRGLRRRGLPQPRPRPPRLPPRRRGLLRRQGLAVHPGAGAARAGQRRRRARSPARGGDQHPGAHLSAARRRRPTGGPRTSSPTADRFDVHRSRRPGRVAVAAGCPLPGDFNVANALAAVAACAEAGLRRRGGGRRHRPTPRACRAGSSGSTRARTSLVVVDYAHKPDAVAAALGTLRPLTDGRVIVVLGAGGDRDPGKRPIMGEIAARLADVLIVTDDNPRTEEPAAIRAEMLAGTRDAAGGGPRDRRPAGRDRRGGTPRRGRATSCSSPARGTRPDRRSTAWCTRSTTATSPGRPSDCWRGANDPDDAGRDRRGGRRRGARRRRRRLLPDRRTSTAGTPSPADCSSRSSASGSTDTTTRPARTPCSAADRPRRRPWSSPTRWSRSAASPGTSSTGSTRPCWR